MPNCSLYAPLCSFSKSIYDSEPIFRGTEECFRLELHSCTQISWWTLLFSSEEHGSKLIECFAVMLLSITDCSLLFRLLRGFSGFILRSSVGKSSLNAERVLSWKNLPVHLKRYSHFHTVKNGVSDLNFIRMFDTHRFKKYPQFGARIKMLLLCSLLFAS